MNRILKFKRDDKIVFLSDPHLGHDRDFLYEPRGCKSVEEHTDMFLKSWNEHIDENTIVFSLGDICFNDGDGKRFDMYSRLPCLKHYVLYGNHNSGLRQAYNAAREHFFDQLGVTNYPDVEVYPVDYNNVTFCGEDLVIRVGKKEIHMSHFPKRIWDHMGRNAFHLSGHSHGNDNGRNVGTGEGKCLDVGIENALKYNGNICFTLDEIYKILDSREIVTVDHHDENTNPSR